MMLVVNVFDSNFAQSACSIAGQTPRLMRYVLPVMEWDGITVFTDEWINNPIVDEVESAHKVGWLREPQCLHPLTYERAETNWHKFDLMLTYYQPLLDRYPDSSQLAVYGGTWIEQPYWGIHPKCRLVSMLVGAKRTTDGHRLRQEIAGRYDAPIDFYGTKGTPVGYGAATKRQVLSQYYFAIVGETCREHNLFTEILLDCFMVGTIPIFWGLPNLEDFFNPAGVIPFETSDDIGQILPLLSPTLYRKMLPAARDNLQLAKQYAVTEDWLVENVFKEMLDG